MADIRIFEMGDIAPEGTVRPSVWRAKQAVEVLPSSTQSDAFGAWTGYVTVQADADCHVEFGADPTATASSFKVLAGENADFQVRPGDKLAVIEA